MFHNCLHLIVNLLRNYPTQFLLSIAKQQRNLSSAAMKELQRRTILCILRAVLYAFGVVNLTIHLLDFHYHANRVTELSNTAALNRTSLKLSSEMQPYFPTVDEQIQSLFGNRPLAELVLATKSGASALSEVALLVSVCTTSVTLAQPVVLYEAFQISIDVAINYMDLRTTIDLWTEGMNRKNNSLKMTTSPTPHISSGAPPSDKISSDVSHLPEACENSEKIASNQNSRRSRVSPRRCEYKMFGYKMDLPLTLLYSILLCVFHRFIKICCIVSYVNLTRDEQLGKAVREQISTFVQKNRLR